MSRPSAKAEFIGGAREIAGIALGFAEITAQGRALRFGGGGDQEVLAAAFGVTEMDAAEAAAEPGVAEAGIDSERLIEGGDGVTSTVLRGQQEPAKSQGFGVAGGEVQAAAQGIGRNGGVAEAKLKFGNAFPGETGLRGEGLSPAGGRQGGIQGSVAGGEGLLIV